MQTGLVGYFKPTVGNFCDMPFEANSFDAAFAMDATCHAPKVNQVPKSLAHLSTAGGYPVCAFDAEDFHPAHAHVIKFRSQLTLEAKLSVKATPHVPFSSLCS